MTIRHRSMDWSTRAKDSSTSFRAAMMQRPSRADLFLANIRRRDCNGPNTVSLFLQKTVTKMQNRATGYIAGCVENGGPGRTRTPNQAVMSRRL